MILALSTNVLQFARFKSFSSAGFNNEDDEGSATEVDSDNQRMNNHALVAEYEAEILAKEKGSIMPGSATENDARAARARAEEEESSSDSEGGAVWHDAVEKKYANARGRAQ